MGGSPSKAEVLAGTAVKGKHDKRVVMPEGIVGQQMVQGRKAGEKLCAFVPSLLAEMNEAKCTSALYNELKRAIAGDKPHNFGFKWKEKEVHATVASFRDRFVQMGVNVQFCRTMHLLYVNGTTVPIWNFWLEFTDLTKAGGVAIINAHAFDPTRDYSKKKHGDLDDLDLVAVVDATAVHEQSPEGEWEADVESFAGATKRWAKSGEMRVSSVAGGICMADWSIVLSAWCFNKKMHAAAPMRAVGPDRYLMRYEGQTHEMLVTADKLETFDMHDKVSRRVTWSRKAAAGVVLAKDKAADAKPVDVN